MCILCRQMVKSSHRYLPNSFFIWIYFGLYVSGCPSQISCGFKWSHANKNYCPVEWKRPNMTTRHVYVGILCVWMYFFYLIYIVTYDERKVARIVLFYSFVILNFTPLNLFTIYPFLLCGYSAYHSGSFMWKNGWNLLFEQCG